MNLKNQVAMKKLYLLIVLLGALTMQGKTTYIPTYRTYFHIVNGIDTLTITSNLDTLELAEPEGMFVLRVDHEDVTHKKVKAIKRAKLAAGLMEFSTVMSGISTAFSTNSLHYMVRSTNTKYASILADIYNENANDEQKLGITAYIDNTSGQELMICDLERGLTWWILPGHSMKLTLNNPDALQLRISDARNERVRYTTMLAGSKVTKRDIELETDDYWYFPVFKTAEIHNSSNLLYYVRISKMDYSIEQLSDADFKAIKKSN